MLMFPVVGCVGDRERIHEKFKDTEEYLVSLDAYLPL